MVFSLGSNLSGINAPEFPVGLEWLNSEPLTMADLQKQDKIVLIDFWTYSCVNCIRTLPHVVDWDKKYRDKGLIIIGVHSPEFEFEKDINNIKRAVKDFGIEYPVIVDSGHNVWDAWRNNVWPRKFLVDTKGKVIYDHSGEGDYAQNEKVIQKALRDTAGKELDFPSITEEESEHSGSSACYPATPETYLGSARGRLRQAWNIAGSWKIEKEYIQHVADTNKFEDYLELNYEALSVNIVAQTSEGEAELKVELDNKAVSSNMRGLNIIERDGETFMHISTPKMYSVISSEKFHKSSLRLYSNSDNIRLYAFTFSACEGVHV